MTTNTSTMASYASLNALPLGIAVISFDQRFVFVNAAMCQLFHYTSSEFLASLSLKDLFRGGLLPAEIAAFPSRLTYSEYNLLTKTGETHPFAITMVSVRSTIGQDDFETPFRLLIFQDLVIIEQAKQQGLEDWLKFSSAQVGLVFYSFSNSVGPELLYQLNTAILTDATTTLEKLGLYLMTAIGQGEEYKTGLFGPLPVPGQDFLSIAYTLLLRDPLQEEKAAAGKRYTLLVLLFPKRLEGFFQDRRRLRTMLREHFASVESIYQVTNEKLESIRYALVHFADATGTGTGTRTDSTPAQLQYSHYDLELKLKATYNLGKELAQATSLTSSFEVLASFCEKVLDFKYFVAMQMDTRSASLIPLVHRGYKAAADLNHTIIPLSSTRSVAAHVARTGQLLNIPRVSEIAFYLAKDPAIISEICVPVKDGEQILGILNAESEQENAFSEDDESLLLLVAERAASILKRYQLQIKLKALYQLTGELAKARDFYEAMDSIATFAEKVLQFHIFCILRVNEEQQVLQIVCYRGYGWKTPADLPTIPINSKEYFVSHVFRTNRPLYVNNLATQTAIPYVKVKPEVTAEYAIPISVKVHTEEKAVGVLNLESTKPLSDDDLSLFEALATQAALIFRLYSYYPHS